MKIGTKKETYLKEKTGKKIPTIASPIRGKNKLPHQITKSSLDFLVQLETTKKHQKN